jgi:hypothetical protein
MTLRVTKKQSATLRSQSNDSLRESAIADGGGEVSSQGNTNSLGEEIAADPRSPKSNSEKASGLPMGRNNKGKSSKNISDSEKSHSIPPNEENEVVMEDEDPSDNDEEIPPSEDGNSSSDSSKSSDKSSDESDESQKERKKRRQKREDSPLSLKESQDSDEEGTSGSYLHLSETDLSRGLATRTDIDSVNTHLRHVLQTNKRKDSLTVLLTDLFEKGYWRSEIDRNESALTRNRSQRISIIYI